MLSQFIKIKNIRHLASLLHTDRIDRTIILGYFLLKIQRIFFEEGYGGFNSVKSFFNHQKFFGFKYTQATKYIRLARHEFHTKQISNQLNTYNINLIYKELGNRGLT